MNPSMLRFVERPPSPCLRNMASFMKSFSSFDSNSMRKSALCHLHIFVKIENLIVKICLLATKISELNIYFVKQIFAVAFDLSKAFSCIFQ